ncbi:DNA-binding response regulator [Oceanobacillus piezotolerans]|uniref:DNA-binding response regulator n=1 Tax=Oceanobacillus piezotolerans TaxID=2448030 RepID=A0A498D835_9BACI|nr:response regulator transcription factor [Oceanobacillus piezotolerans]RLL46686.1 DNA-binding response regulator [Oceanobacillus piezotolerans]
MSHIALIKEKGLIRESIIGILQEKLPEHTFRAYTSEEVTDFYQNRCDLLIIDIDAAVEVFDLISYCKKENIKVAVWIAAIEREQVVPFLEMGLEGYFYNGMETVEVCLAINAMLNDENYVHSRLATLLIDEYVYSIKRTSSMKKQRPVNLLTQQEWNILEQIAKGEKNENIAKNLFISSNTVNSHVSSILKKLNVSDRTSAAVLAVKQKWISV